ELLKSVMAAGAELVVELTEENLVTGDSSAMACLERIRKLGIGLAIAGLAKGSSRPGPPKESPPAEAKRAKRCSPPAGSAGNEKDKQIMRVIVELARAFQMSVVAEGVDSARALQTVAALGCDAAQGFFIARPMRADLIVDWIRSLEREADRFAVGAEAAH